MVHHIVVRTHRAGGIAWIRLFADQQAMVDLINDPATDLFSPLPNSGEHRHNILREIKNVASHNAYHIGELGVLRQVMGLWRR